MKFILDVCLGTFLEQKLISYFTEDDFLCIRDINSRMLDIEIVSLAITEQRIIITADKDFGDLIFQQKLQHCGVLLMRFDEYSFDEKSEMLIKILENHKEDLPNKFAVYQPPKLRIR